MLRHAALFLVTVTLVAAGCAPASTQTGDSEPDTTHAVVPSVTGLPLAEATARVEEAGYVVGELSGDTEDPDATVAVQYPIASTSLPRGGEVDLEVTGNR